jgi:hypothetical protein
MSVLQQVWLQLWSENRLKCISAAAAAAAAAAAHWLLFKV